MPSSTSQTSTRKITLTLPETLLERLDEQVPPGHRTEFIVEAIEERLAIAEQSAALDEAAGSWTDENHPELATPEDIDRWLAELRGIWVRTADDAPATA